MAEFAIAIAVFLLLLLGGIEFGLIFWQKSTVASAARDGARYAMVRGAESGRTADSSMVATYVQSRASLSPLKVITTWPATKNPGEMVHVRVEYVHRPGMPVRGLLLPDSIVLAGTSRMVLVF